jgi:hypothetical protein
MGDLDRQASVLLAGDVEAEHHVMPLCMCFAALSRNALANRLLRQMRRRPPLGGSDRRRRRAVGAASVVSAAPSHQPSRATTGPGSIGLVVEVDADGDQHDQDGGGDPVDDRAERRPPASVGHKVAVVLPQVLNPWPVKPTTSSHAGPVTPAAATTTKTAAIAASTAMTLGRPSATAKPM